MDLLSEGQRAELGLIHLALERIERGIFGLCEECSERISEAQLLETPWKPACAACEAQRATLQAAPEVGAPNLPL